MIQWHSFQNVLAVAREEEEAAMTASVDRTAGDWSCSECYRGYFGATGLFLPTHRRYFYTRGDLKGSCLGEDCSNLGLLRLI